MAMWVLMPFVILTWANARSQRWSRTTRTALYAVTTIVAVASLAVYADDAVSHRALHPAFVYVIVSPVSCGLIAIVIGLTAISSRPRH
jgi:multisubunit Na+/H+ antiporter MnhG subunit